MTIKPKMYLNASPQTAEDGSLVFAKNMKIGPDGSIMSDFGYDAITAQGLDNYRIRSHIVGLDNKIYLLCTHKSNYTYHIIEYDEVEKTINVLSTKWKYGMTNIVDSTFTGAVTTNISGEKILTIAECPNEPTERVPLKHINLSHPNVADESLYCQAPLVPIVNLKFNRTYSKTIPNGTYIFFIRYKIRDGVFTKWYPCSRPCFAGTSEVVDTFQGGVEHINIHRDSANSFVFDVDIVNVQYCSYYTGFQLGFIITHDEGTSARAWKYFDFHYNSSWEIDNIVYFDYDNVTEIDIEDLTEPTYEIYNVKNVAVFKNQLYISNYVESTTNKTFPSINSSNVVTLVKNKIENDNQSFLYKYNGYTYPFTWLVDDVYTGSQDWHDLVNRGLIGTSYGDVVKEKTKTYENVLNFVIAYNLDEDPDFTVIYDIRNKLIDEAGNPSVFGHNYNKSRLSVLSDYDWSEKDGLYIKPLSEIDNTHPFYRNTTSTPDDAEILGSRPMPMGFVCTKQEGDLNSPDKIGVTDNEYTIYPINTNTAHSKNGSLVFTGRDNGFNKSAKELMISYLTDIISNQERNRIMGVELYYGTDCAFIDDDTYHSVSDLNKNANSVNKSYYVPTLNTYGVEIISPIEEGAITGASMTSLNNYINIVLNKSQKHLSYSGEVVFDVNGLSIYGASPNYVKASTLKVKLRKYEFITNSEEISSNDDEWVNRITVNLKVTDYAVLCNLKLNGTIEYSNNSENLTQESSLLPFTTYDVYIHHVDDHHIISDGQKLFSYNTTEAKAACHNKIDLAFFLNKPQNINGYNANAFFSIVNTGNYVARCFDYNHKGADHYVSCLELDALLYNETSDFSICIVSYDDDTYGPIIVRNKINGLEYLSSGNVKPADAFGNCGFLHWKEANSSTDYSSGYVIWLIIQRNIQDAQERKLIKASHIFRLNISGSSAASKYVAFDTPAASYPVVNIQLTDNFYGSYVCNVRKPSFKLANGCYVSGNDIYSVKKGNTITLNDFTGVVQMQSGTIYNVLSNFNLNYLSLVQDINDKIFSIGSAGSGLRQVAKVIDSALLSYIYELRSMYKDFMNIYYRPMQSYYKDTFDNTIRVSNVLSDETFNNDIYRFKPVDYYNVPTDRGKIVKLFSIGNAIYVHNESSFYRFDGNQTIMASKEDITLKESQPFETGIVQLFDSEYGYGGIKEKSASCVTFDSYFFYDQESNHIFAYRDNQPIVIDGNIRGFLDSYLTKVVSCRTVHDIDNNRILFTFLCNPYNNFNMSFTISYNYKSKSFVSFHTMVLENCFSTKRNVYHYNTDGFGILFKIKSSLTPSNGIYGPITRRNVFLFYDDPYPSYFQIAVMMYAKQSIVESLDFVKYIGDIVQTCYTDVTTRNGVQITINPVSTTNPVVGAYIVTDMCKSNEVRNDVDVSDDSMSERTDADTQLANIKGFKFERGTWNFNYFRDISKSDVFKYKQAGAYRYDNYHDQTERDLVSDRDSLIYGKYFIIVLKLKDTKPVKIEDLFITTHPY